MQYKKTDRRKRLDGDMLDGRPQTPNKFKGTRYTVYSFMAVVGSLAVMKALNPDLPMRSPVIMVASVAMACVVMTIVGRRSK